MTDEQPAGPAAHSETHAFDEEPGLKELLIAAWREPDQAPQLVIFFVCLVMLCAVFHATLANFWNTWSTNDNYSHGFLVPFLSLYFANEAARRGPIRIQGGYVLGMLLLLAAILGRWATVLVPVGFVGDLSFLAGLAGVITLCFGRSALRRYGFALVFLLFMIPLPVALYAAIASPLQLWVSQMAGVILNAIGVPVLCEGNLMTLPGDLRLFVAEACSGMRQLTGFLALSTAVAFWAARPWWYRTVLVLSAIPIAMTANLIRVVLTGWIMHHIAQEYAMGTFHTIEGLLMMMLGLGLLYLEIGLLNTLIAADEPQGCELGRGQGSGRLPEPIASPN